MKILRHLALATCLALGCSMHLAAQNIPPSYTSSPSGEAGRGLSSPQGEEGRGLPLLGYLSYNTVLTQLPEYAQAQEQFQQLKSQYDAEAQRTEAEFQRKFSEFLQGQKDFPRSIMQKRQTELQQLMEQGVQFRQKSQQLLNEAQDELLKPVRQRLDAAIANVAARVGLICVVNTDSNATPFLAPKATIDITTFVMEELGIATNP